jgi:hypothetical protein
MKRVILTSAFTLVTLLASAQDFSFGLRGGINLFDITIDELEDPNNTIGSVESGSREIGYHAGAYARFKFTTFFIQPELLYTFENNEIVYTDNGGSEKSLDVDFSRLDVPVILGLKLGPVRIGAGPVATFAISKPEDAFEQSLKDATFGYQAGIGLDIGSISVDLRYEGPFGQYAESVTIEGNTYQADARSSMFMLGLGVELF